MPKKERKSKQKQKQKQSVSQRQKVKVIVNLGKAMQRRQAKRQAKRQQIQQPAVNQIWTYQPQQLLSAPQYQQPVTSQGTFVSAGQQQGQPLGGQSFTNINEQRQNALGGQPFQERETQPYSITNQFNQRQQSYLLDDVGYDESEGQMVPFQQPPSRGRIEFEDDEPEGQMVPFQQPPSRGRVEFEDDESEGQMVPFQQPPSRGRVEFEDDEPEGQMVLYTPLTQQPTQPQTQIIPKSRVDFDNYFDDYFDNLQQTYLFDDPPRGLGAFEIPTQVLGDLFRPRQPLLLLNEEQAEAKPSIKKKKKKTKLVLKEDIPSVSYDEVESGAVQRRKGRPKGSKNKSKEVLLQERLKKQAKRDAREQRREELLRQSGYTTDNPQDF